MQKNKKFREMWHNESGWYQSKKGKRQEEIDMQGMWETERDTVIYIKETLCTCIWKMCVREERMSLINAKKYITYTFTHSLTHMHTYVHFIYTNIHPSRSPFFSHSVLISKQMSPFHFLFSYNFCSLRNLKIYKKNVMELNHMIPSDRPYDWADNFSASNQRMS